MYRCRACATAFVDPMLTDEELTAYYARYHLSDDEGGLYDSVERRMEADFPAKLALLKGHVSPPARVLDVGCGKGFFARACQGAGYRVKGLDLSESGVEYAKQKLGVDAVCGDIRNFDLSDGAYDAVTFWATIEHLPRPVETLTHIARVLKPGGVLLLDTGIGDDWLDRLLPGRVQWYDPPQHLFVFSNEGLRRAVEQAGFQVVANDSSFERTPARRAIKTVPNGVMAGCLRAVAVAGRMRLSDESFVRFPIGNLQLMVARRTGT